MTRLEALRAARVAALDDAEAILAAAQADGDRELTEDETASYSAAMADVDALEVKIKREEDLERRRAVAAVPVQPLVMSSAPLVAPAQAAQPLDPGVGFSRIVRCFAAGGMDQRRAANFAEQAYGSQFGEVVANLEQSTDTKGGFLVEEQWSKDFIDILRPRVVVRRMGARTVGMPAGNLTTKRKTAGSSAGYIGERAAIPVTGATFGELKMSAKKLAALVPITNDLLRHSSDGADMIVREDLQEMMGVTEDQQFLRGTGSATEPPGLLDLVNASNLITANATVNLINIEADLDAALLALLNNNIPMIAPGWIMSNRTKLFLASIRDANGNKAFPTIDANNTLKGYPIATTTSVPDNLGAGTDESEVYLVDFSQVWIGDTYRLTIAASDVASYDDGGTVRSAFQNDETLIRVIQEHDLNVRHDTALAVLEAVRWF